MAAVLLLIGWKIPPLSVNQFRNNSPVDSDGGGGEVGDWNDDRVLCKDLKLTAPMEQQNVMNKAAPITANRLLFDDAVAA